MKAKIFLSACFGFFFALIGFLILLVLGTAQAFSLSLMGGLLTALLLFLFLIVHEETLNRRYRKLEEALPSPVFYKTDGHFHFANCQIKHGNIYFCESGIVCANLEENPHTLEALPRENIDHFTYTFTQLNVYTRDGRLFLITAPKVNEIMDLLIRKGWITAK